MFIEKRFEEICHWMRTEIARDIADADLAIGLWSIVVRGSGQARRCVNLCPSPVFFVEFLGVEVRKMVKAKEIRRVDTGVVGRYVYGPSQHFDAVFFLTCKYHGAA